MRWSRQALLVAVAEAAVAGAEEAIPADTAKEQLHKRDYCARRSTAQLHAV